uniref:Uncharacterized protein n=1 Tax=Micrurus lemniscatus lemniscatus TaxID=129467 RepID=A0A2D4HBF5_MICLE
MDELRDIQNIEILPYMWADHNPLQIIWKDQICKRNGWTLNPQILKEKEYIQKIREKLGVFFKFNKKQDTLLKTLWDTMKAYLRGVSIAYLANKNKEKWKKQNILIKIIKSLEDRLTKTTGDEQIRNYLAQCKHEINILDQEELVKKLQYIKQNHFEYANKPGRWLAYKLKKENQKRNIDQLEYNNGVLETDLKKKKTIIREYFEIYIIKT